MHPRPLTPQEAGKRAGRVLRNRRLFVLEQMVTVAAAHRAPFICIPREDWRYMQERLREPC